MQIQIHFQRTDGTYDDAYADNLSFVLTNDTTPATITGTVSGTIFKDTNGNGIQSSSTENGIVGVDGGI